MTTPATAEELRSLHAKEYGQYVAVEHIYIDGGLAFAPGHPVPAGHVESGVVGADQVKAVKSAKPADANLEKKG